MAINSIDYSKSLAENRDRYRIASREMGEGHLREQQRLKDTQELAADKAKENYAQARENMEKGYQDNLSNIKDNTDHSLDKIKQSYNNILKGERERFSKEKTENLQEFNQSLSNVKDSFNRSLEMQKDESTKFQKSNEKNYENQVKNMDIRRENEIKDILEESSNKRGDVDGKETEARKRLVNSHLKEQAQARKEFNEKLPEEMAKKNTQIDTLRLLGDRQHEEKEQQQVELRKENKGDINRALKTSEDQFNYLADKLGTGIYEYKKKNNEVLAERLNDINRNAYDEKNALLNKLAKANQDKGDTDKFLEGLNKYPDGNFWDKKLDSFRNVSVKDRRAMVEKGENARLDYIENLKNNNLENNQKRIDLEKGFIERMARNSIKDRDEKDSIVDHFRTDKAISNDLQEKFLKQTQKKNQDQVISERVKLQEKIDNNNEINHQTIDNLRNHFARKGKEQGLKLEREKNQMFKELNFDFQKKMDKTTDVYESKIKDLIRDIEGKDDDFDFKLKKQNEHKAREIEFTNQFNKERHYEDDLAKRETLKYKDIKHQEQLEEIQEANSQKINSLLNTQSKKMKKMVEDYEDRINKMEAEIHRSVQREVMANKREHISIKQEHEAEVRKLISTYEQRIIDMRVEQERYIERIKNKTT